MSEGGGSGGGTGERPMLVIGDERLRDGLMTLAYAGLSGVLSEIIAHINKQGESIARLEEELKATKDELARESTRALQKENQIELSVAAIKTESKALATEESIIAFKYETERHLHELEEGSAKVHEDIQQVQEEVKALSGEVAQANADQAGIRGDLTRLGSELPELKDDWSRQHEELAREVHAHIEAEAEASASGSKAATIDEVKGIMRAELDSVASAGDEKVAKAVEKLEAMAKTLEGDITAVLEGKLKMLAPVEDLERLRQELEKAKVMESVKQIKALAKTIAKLQGDLKAITTVVENDTKKVDSCREMLDNKAEQSALQDLAKFLLDKTRELQTNAAATAAAAAEQPATASADGQPPQQQQPPQTAPQAVGMSAEEVERMLMEKIAEKKSRSSSDMQAFQSSSTAAVAGIDQKLDKLNDAHLDTQNKLSDVRRDLFELGQLVEALSTELKTTKEAVRGSVGGADASAVGMEVTSQIEKLSQQFAEVLKKKADLLVIEQLIQEKDNEHKQELETLQQSIDRKAGQEELLRLKKAIEKDLHKTLMQGTGGQRQPQDGLEGTDEFMRTAIGRSQYKCLACDKNAAPSERASSGLPFPLPVEVPTYFDLAPNIAYKRWMVKDMIKATKDAANPRPTGPTPKEPAGTKKTMQQAAAIAAAQVKRPSSAGCPSLPPIGELGPAQSPQQPLVIQQQPPTPTSGQPQSSGEMK